MSSNGGHNTIQYNLRWSEEMRDKIAAAAKDNTRSMNQEIIARLEQSFENNQATYAQAFTEASVKVISHVMDSLLRSGLSEDQIRVILNEMKTPNTRS